MCECACERAQTEHKSIGGGKQRFPHTAAHRESVANRGPPSLPRWSSFWSLARVLDLSLCFNRFSCPCRFMNFNGISHPYCFLSFATRKPLSLPGAKEPSQPTRTGTTLRAAKRLTGPEANDRGPVQPRQSPFEIPFEKPYGFNGFELESRNPSPRPQSSYHPRTLEQSAKSRSRTESFHDQWANTPP